MATGSGPIPAGTGSPEAVNVPPERHVDAADLVDSLIAQAGKRIVLALPLGLGKAVHVANALYRRAVQDPGLSLHIVTALTLTRPRPGSTLERRFIEPVIERLFGGYPELDYVDALRRNDLPPNIKINEFFFQAGSWLNQPLAQQGHICANYTDATDYVLRAGVNVVAQLVAPAEENGDARYSLSCNPDITVDLLKARLAGRACFKLVGEVNPMLPFMGKEAARPADEFSHLLEGEQTCYPLFAPPKRPVSMADHAIGLQAATLIPDGGTLQLGIGSISDAVSFGLILRHRQNGAFKRMARSLRSRPIAGLPVFDDVFEEGIYGASEMFVDSFLDLARAGVLAREVDGALLHAGFFVGPKAFYDALRTMRPQERDRFQMRAISFVNALYGDEDAKRRARVKARFVNNAMMATLLGAVISDGLENGSVVSGVGGQYNFVAQAFALRDARSIIALNATRKQHGKTISNIRWTYGHTTIPRHLRDIVVTEYGVADLRGQSDCEVIKAMLSVCDSRFQEKLMAEAKAAGKLEKGFELPADVCQNTPARIKMMLEPAFAEGLLPRFPFGSDFTALEQKLMDALSELKDASSWQLGRLLAKGLLAGPPDAADRAALERMGLSRPRGASERGYHALVRAALLRQGGQEQAKRDAKAKVQLPSDGRLRGR